MTGSTESSRLLYSVAAFAISIVLVQLWSVHSSLAQSATVMPEQSWSCLKRKDLLRDRQGRALWLSSSDLMSRVVEKQPVQRPDSLGRNNLRGVVTIQVLIDRKGKVSCARGVGGNPIGVAAAMRSLNGWSFRPYDVKGRRKSVAGVLLIPFDFTDGGSNSVVGIIRDEH